MPKLLKITTEPEVDVGGRPTVLTPQRRRKFLNLVREGKNIHQACRMVKLITPSDISRFLDEDESFLDEYLNARRIGIEMNSSEMLDLVDRCPANTSAEVQKVKLQIDTRKWLLSKLIPDIYGDKTTYKTADTEQDSSASEELEAIVKKIQDRSKE
jgi:hypothetical protein